MIKGTTPTLTLTLPEEVDLEQASHVFITFANKDNKRLLELQDDEIEIAENDAHAEEPDPHYERAYDLLHKYIYERDDRYPLPVHYRRVPLTEEQP